MATLALIAAFAIVLSLSCRQLTASKYPALFAPLTVFLAAWTFALVARSSLGMVYGPASSSLQIYLLSALVAAVVGTVFTSLTWKPKHSQITGPQVSDTALRISAYVGLLGALGVALYTIETFAGGSLTALFANSDTIRIERFELTQTGPPAYFSVCELLYLSGTGTAFTAIQLRSDATHFVVAANLLSTSAIMVLTSARTPFFIAVVTLILSVAIRDGFPRTLRRLLTRRNFAGVLVALIASSLVAGNRDDGIEISFDIFQIRCGDCLPDNPVTRAVLSNALYPASSISNLDDSLEEPPNSYPYLPDATFAGFVSPFERIGVLRSEIETGPVLGEAGVTNRVIFSDRALYNTFTGFDNMREDFGSTGSIFFLTLLFVAGSRLAASPPAHLARRFLGITFLFWCAASPMINSFGDQGKAAVSGLAAVIILQMGGSRKSKALYLVRPQHRRLPGPRTGNDA